MRMLLPWLLLMAVPAVALEARDARGLDVTLEVIAETIEVDGLPFRIQRATGPDVAKLAARVADRWRAAGSPLQELSQGAWRMLSRWDGAYAELLQWRGEDASAELLYSRFDALRRARPVGAAPLPLPARCRWGREIRGMAGGQSYQQRTALCRGTVAALQAELQERLVAAGWRWREATPGALQVMREGSQGLVTLATARRVGECWLVWVGNPAMREARR